MALRACCSAKSPDPFPEIEIDCREGDVDKDKASF